LIKQITD